MDQVLSAGPIAWDSREFDEMSWTKVDEIFATPADRLDAHMRSAMQSLTPGKEGTNAS